MNCALWLNKQKVQHASKIRENLDIAALRGYFLAGSLIEWLRENGGEEYAKKLSKISADDPDLNKKLAKIFGGKPLPSKSMRSEEFFAQTDGAASAMSSYSAPSSGSFGFINYGSGSFSYLQISSFGEFWEFLQNIRTSSFGSFGFGSYSQWEWFFSLFRQGYGSFSWGSFSSFHQWEWAWEWFFSIFSQGYGSFSWGSFSSFHEWEWEWLRSLFGGGSFSMSSFGSFFERFFGGSFRIGGSLNAPYLDEYDRIMLETLMRCPLDRFGYGIHNI